MSVVQTHDPSPMQLTEVAARKVKTLALMQQLQSKLPGFKVGSTSDHGLHADCVEAAAFAWFAQQTLEGIPIDFSPFTGAAGPVIAGGIYRA